MNPFLNCPEVKTNHFSIRLICKNDSASLFKCYNNKTAVELMNDDNCDFGFYTESVEKMTETVGYWIDFYNKQYFIRFTIVDNKTGVAVGTIEGFCGEIGVLRVDIASEFEKEEYLSELFNFAKSNFYEYFGNEYLVTKAIPKADERCKALKNANWEFIDEYKDYKNYFKIKTDR